MKELIERLEKAAGPDRELDALIDARVRIGKTEDVEWRKNRWLWDNFPVWRARSDGRVEVVHDDGTGGVHWAPEHFTSSIDAALTLVPEQEKYGLSIDFDIDRLQWAVSVIGWNYAETIPIALCIAALRAREALARSPAGKGEA